MLQPYNYAEQIPLLEFSAKQGIVIEAYSTLLYVPAVDFFFKK